MVLASECAHGYTGQQGEKARYLSRMMSTRVGKGLIRVRSRWGIEWIRSRSVRMAIEVSRMKKEDVSGGRCPPGSGRVSLESTS